MRNIKTSRATVIGTWMAGGIGGAFWVTAMVCHVAYLPVPLLDGVLISSTFIGYTLILVSLVCIVSLLLGASVGRWFCPVLLGAAGFMAGYTVVAFLIRMKIDFRSDAYRVGELCAMAGLEIAGIALGCAIAVVSPGFGGRARGFAWKGCVAGLLVGAGVVAVLVPAGAGDGWNVFETLMTVMGYGAAGGAAASVGGVERRSGAGFVVEQMVGR